MQTFSVQLPLVPLTVGDVVDRAAWPAHITLIGNFRARDGDVVEATVGRFAATTTPPVRVALEDEAWLGPDRTVLVDLVEVPPLRALHTQLLDELEAEVDGLELILRSTRETASGRTARSLPACARRVGHPGGDEDLARRARPSRCAGRRRAPEALATRENSPAGPKTGLAH